MSHPTPVRIGMLSYAHGHAHSYTTALQALSGVEIVGIWDEDPIRLGQVAERHGLPAFDQVADLLARGLDGVVICAANSQHRPLVEAAAGQTRHILCEKPIATTLADAQAMIDICAQSQTRLQIAFPVRFAPSIQRLKKLVDGGTLGQIYATKCTNHGSMPGSWFVQPELSGGGAVIDHTVHVIDVLRWLWGAEVVEIYAEVGFDLLHPGLGVDDVGLLSFRLANGIYGTLDTSWSRPKSYTTWGDVKIELVGERGTVWVDAFRQHLNVGSDQWGKSRWVGWGSNMDQGLVADFVHMIRDDREPSITGYDGFKALEVALAAYESSRCGLPISLSTVAP